MTCSYKYGMKVEGCSKGDAILLQEVYCKPFNSLPVHFILPRPTFLVTEKDADNNIVVL